jgi:hypothetical protein
LLFWLVHLNIIILLLLFVCSRLWNIRLTSHCQHTLVVFFFFYYY